MTNRFVRSKIITGIVLISLLAGCTPQAALPSGPGALWDLVVIGDSSLWLHGEAFASQIEADLGVKVTLHDFAISNVSASQLLELFETGKTPNSRLEKLPESVRQAEVVVMFVLPEESVDLDHPSGLDDCFYARPPGDCSMESFSAYTADMKAIWGKIIALRKGKATILRATDIYCPLVDNWHDAGIFAECTTCWINLSAAARQAAEAYNIPFASRYDLFNGVSHNWNPQDKGYTDRGGEHPTEQAGLEFAGLLAKLGYEPVRPTR